MGGKGDEPDLPPPVDPNELIQTQAQVNRVNQVTPFGSVSFTGPNRNNLSMKLNPRLQALFNTQTQFGNESAREGLGFLRGSDFSPIDVPGQDQIASQIFDLGAGQLEPFFDRRRDTLQSQLENTGNPAVGVDLAPGAVSELDLIGRQENQALGDLALNAALSVPQFQGQLIENQIAQLGGNVNTALALAGGSPVGIPDLGSFYGPSAIDVTGPYSIAQNAAMNRAQIQQQQNSDFFGGLVDLGVAGISAFGGV